MDRTIFQPKGKKWKRQKKAAVLVCDDDLSQSGSDSNTASSSAGKIELKIRCKRKAETKMKMKAATISAKEKTSPVKVTVPAMEKAIVSDEESTTKLESEESTSEDESESEEITRSDNKSKEKPKTASKKQDEKILTEEHFGWKLGIRAFDTRSPSQCHLRPRLVEFDTITTDEFAYFLHFFPYVI